MEARESTALSRGICFKLENTLTSGLLSRCLEDVFVYSAVGLFLFLCEQVSTAIKI